MKSTNASKHAVRANMLANLVATANKNFQDQLSGELNRFYAEVLALIEQAEHVRGRLSDPELRLPAPKAGVRTLDPAKLAAELTADTEALATALRPPRGPGARQGDDARKAQALAELRVGYLSLTGRLVHRFRLTGLNEVAEAIRSLLRGRKSATPEPEQEPEPVAGDDAPASEHVTPA